MPLPFPYRPRGSAGGAEPAPSEPPRGVLTELARGFLRGLATEDPRCAARFAGQFLAERAEEPPLGRRRHGPSPPAPRDRPRPEAFL
ncbi:MAG: hypothetical protein ACREC5_04520 [Thermoplasmata archaeon]